MSQNCALCGGYGFRVMVSENFLRELRRAHLPANLDSHSAKRAGEAGLVQECKRFSFKKNKNWREKLADFKVPNKIQP